MSLCCLHGPRECEQGLTGVGRELASPGDEGAAGELAGRDGRKRDGRNDRRVGQGGLTRDHAVERDQTDRLRSDRVEPCEMKSAHLYEIEWRRAARASQYESACMVRDPG